jgi:hypothetical protein
MKNTANTEVPDRSPAGFSAFPTFCGQDHDGAGGPKEGQQTDPVEGDDDRIVFF